MRKALVVLGTFIVAVTVVAISTTATTYCEYSGSGRLALEYVVDDSTMYMTFYVWYERPQDGERNTACSKIESAKVFGWVTPETRIHLQWKEEGKLEEVDLATFCALAVGGVEVFVWGWFRVVGKERYAARLIVFLEEG